MNEAMRRLGVSAVIVTAAIGFGVVRAQQPPAGGAAGGGAARGGGGAARGPVFSVTSPSFADGAEVPMRHAGRGENKSPQFDFHWYAAGTLTAADAPANIQSYAVVFHDIENATARGTTDTLHWTIFNIPGSAKGMAEGLGAGDLPDGSRNGPGINARGGNPGSYFGPGAGPGPFHHYIWEFYALDAKIDLPATATRDELMKAMEGHVIGKAAYTGRFHG